MDVLEVDSIERYENLVNYWMGDLHKTFNPDFWVRKGKEVILVEVEMRWSTDIDHHYNKTIPFKRKALEAFCKKKGYKMIWLDFDYDERFAKIYRKHLRACIPSV